MAWIKIQSDPDVYAKEASPDPAEIITGEQLESEKAEIEDRLKALYQDQESLSKRLNEIMNILAIE